MALLKLSDDRIYSDRIHSNSDAIAQTLAPLNICLTYFPLTLPDLSLELLDLDVLKAHQKQQIMALHKQQFIALARKEEYSWCDLLVVHPGLPSLQTLISNYGRHHIHSAPEALYMLLGEAIFGFVQPDGNEIQILVQSGDYLHIPSQTEHWFSTAGLLSFKAVRYFATADSWIPYYTGTDMNDPLHNQA